MIFRKWSGRIRTAQADEYVRYVEETGAAHYAATEGNLGYQILLRDVGDGTSEISTVSWWTDLDAVRRFAGDDYGVARYYPEDDRYLLSRPELVEHYEVRSGPGGHPGAERSHGWKPDGYTSVAPYLVVDGAAGTIEFVRRVFDAVELRRFPDATGKVTHAEVRIGDTVVMIADGVPPAWPPVPAHVHVYVEDVDAAYRRALEAGAQSVQEPVKKDDADKRGGVRDLGGTTWWIATKVE